MTEHCTALLTADCSDGANSGNISAYSAVCLFTVLPLASRKTLRKAWLRPKHTGLSIGTCVHQCTDWHTHTHLNRHMNRIYKIHVEKCSLRFQSVASWVSMMAETDEKCLMWNSFSLWFINGALCRARLSLHRGSSWCNHKRDVFMNGALTDECELTATEERTLSSPVLTWDDIHHSDSPGSLSHVSSFCIQSHRNTERHHAHGYAQAHSFILYLWSV